MSEKHMNACNGEGYEIGSAILCNVEVDLLNVGRTTVTLDPLSDPLAPTTP